MTILISALAPVILIIIIGYIAGTKFDLDGKTLSILNISVLSPALIFDSLSHSSLSLNSATGLIIGFLITSFFLYALIIIIKQIFLFSPNFNKSLIATTLFANTGNLGLPFISFSLGDDGLARALIYMISGSVLMAIFAPALLTGAGLNYGLKLTFKMPLFWATLGGIYFNIASIKLPFNLELGIKLLGQTAIPLALLLLGIQLSQGDYGWGKKEFLASGLRLIIAPIVSIVVASLLNLERLDFQVLVLQGAMPSAVSSYIFVNEFGGDAPLTARIILISTILSLLTLPIFLLILKVNH